MRVILVTSSRTWTDEYLLTLRLGEAVRELGGPANVIIRHGKARGGDAMADRFGICHGIKRQPRPADWDRHGKAAGFIRNCEMAEEEPSPSLCLAFLMPCTNPKCQKPQPHDTHGASQCADYAEKAGIETRRYRP